MQLFRIKICKFFLEYRPRQNFLRRKFANLLCTFIATIILSSSCLDSQRASTAKNNQNNLPETTKEMLCGLNSSLFQKQKVQSLPYLQKIIIVILENEDRDKAISNPIFKKISQEGTYFSEYHALYHSSQPNYIALIAGTNFNHNSNADIDIDDIGLHDLIEQSGRTWGVFAENYPGNCFLKDAEPYARRHNPFISFKNISQNSDRCQNITSTDSFFEKWKNNQLPNFSFYIPNNINNGHDTSLDFAANWFEKTFGTYISNPSYMKDTLFILTFDEDGNRNVENQNRIFTVFLGPMVKKNNQIISCYNHFSLLRTFEEIWSLGSLKRNDLTSQPIIEAWHQE